MKNFTPQISNSASAASPPKTPLVWGKPSVRRAEGLPQTSGVLGGEAAEAEFEICGVKFFIDLLSAQKTGFYLDQISHYPVVTEFAAGRRVLDCFSNEGAFALICAQAGASEVIGVELQTNAI